MDRFFFFRAQTGQIRMESTPLPPSNFHTYVLRATHLEKVREAVEQAELGSGGLVYPGEFIRWLADNDQG